MDITYTPRLCGEWIDNHGKSVEYILGDTVSYKDPEGNKHKLEAAVTISNEDRKTIYVLNKVIIDTMDIWQIGMFSSKVSRIIEDKVYCEYMRIGTCEDPKYFFAKNPHLPIIYGHEMFYLSLLISMKRKYKDWLPKRLEPLVNQMSLNFV